MRTSRSCRKDRRRGDDGAQSWIVLYHHKRPREKTASPATMIALRLSFVAMPNSVCRCRWDQLTRPSLWLEWRQ